MCVGGVLYQKSVMFSSLVFAPEETCDQGARLCLALNPCPIYSDVVDFVLSGFDFYRFNRLLPCKLEAWEWNVTIDRVLRGVGS